jgi:hypothetical protein
MAQAPALSGSAEADRTENSYLFHHRTRSILDRQPSICLQPASLPITCRWQRCPRRHCAASAISALDLVTTEATMMFLSCPAHLDPDGGVSCDLPAEVVRRFTMHSTDGPLEAAMIRCPVGHWFNGPIEALTSRGTRPPGRPGRTVRPGSGCRPAAGNSPIEPRARPLPESPSQPMGQRIAPAATARTLGGLGALPPGRQWPYGRETAR